MSSAVTGTQLTSDYIQPKEFLEIQDKDFQKFLYLRGLVRDFVYLRKIDNEDKIGYYQICVSIRINQKGVFYPTNKLLNWLVYNKKTKKVATSKITASAANDSVVRMMFNDKFRYPELFKPFMRYVTPTLVKRILQGKVQSIRDVLRYHASYTFRNKTLTPEVLYDAFLTNNERLIHIFEDPENIDWYDTPKLQSIPVEMVNGKVFKIKSSEVDNVGERYKNWVKEQNKKYANFRPGRNEEFGVDTF